MTEVDTAARHKELQPKLGNSYVRSGTVWDGWVKDCWKKYRGK